VDILFVGTLFVDIRSAATRSAATLFVDTLCEKAALIAPPSSFSNNNSVGCTAREELEKRSRMPWVQCSE
jgi:hypothetical protein